MTNDTTYRTKASAIFFAAVMVASMVVVGFAAAPAAAQDASYDDTDALIGELVWQGQVIEVSGLGTGNDISLREATDGDSRFVEELNTGGDGTVEIDTESLDAGDYFIRGGDSTMDDDNTFEVAVQDLDIEFDENSVETNDVVGLEINSNRGTYDVNVSADGDLDDDQLVQLFEDEFGGDVSVGDDDGDDEILIEDVSDGTYDADFDNVDDLSTGDYEFTFEVTDTSADATASIDVGEAGEGDLDLAEGSTTVARGDVAEVTVEFDGDVDSGSVVIGTFDDNNYQANISVEDGNGDGEVTVLFNTYTAGNSQDDIVEAAAADDDDEATLENADDQDVLSDLLDTGDYDVFVSPTGIDNGDAEDALDDATDIGSLIIEGRSTDEMRLWRTSDSVRDDVVDVQDDENDGAAVGAIIDGVEDGVVTETDTVAIGDSSDVLVHQITASGLKGALDAQGSSDNARALYRVLDSSETYDDEEFNTATLTFTEADPGANQDANEIDATALSEGQFAAAVDVVYDAENGDYYVFLDLDTLNGALDDTDIDRIEDGDEYTVEFAVRDPLLTGADTDDDAEDIEDAVESVDATFGAEEAEIDFDSDPVEVENAEDQTISGTTNVAPGTEVDIRVRSDDSEANFIKNAEDNIVTADGTFSGTFDFSEENVNDTFTVQTRNTPASTEAEADGTVVDSIEGVSTFEVSDLEPSEATATAGDSVTVSATIENTGNAEGTESVALTLDGDEVDTQDVTIAGGDSTTVEFTVDTSGLGAGDYEHGVATSADEATGTLTIEAADGDGGTDGDGTDGDGGTDDSTPGFGALVALVSLIAAALLATRRTE